MITSGTNSQLARKSRIVIERWLNEHEEQVEEHGKRHFAIKSPQVIAMPKVENSRCVASWLMPSRIRLCDQSAKDGCVRDLRGRQTDWSLISGWSLQAFFANSISAKSSAPSSEPERAGEPDKRKLAVPQRVSPLSGGCDHRCTIGALGPRSDRRGNDRSAFESQRTRLAFSFRMPSEINDLYSPHSFSLR
jgi:hypothetical protein